jgi:hypothetical protein
MEDASSATSAAGEKGLRRDSTDKEPKVGFRSFFTMPSQTHSCHRGRYTRKRELAMYVIIKGEWNFRSVKMYCARTEAPAQINVAQSKQAIPAPH